MRKLQDVTVRKIRLAYDGLVSIGIPHPVSYQQIADKYGLSKPSVYDIIHGKSYKNVTPSKCYNIRGRGGCST